MRAIAVPDRELVTDPDRLVRRYLDWAPRASGDQRAEAASALARGYLHCDWSAPTRDAAELAIMAALDDLDVRVRRAVAEAFASARGAPRRIVLALASDIAEVARPVLALSPVLTEADLIDVVTHGDALAHLAIAARAGLRAKLVAALAEVCSAKAAIVLLDNLDAEISVECQWRLFARLRSRPELRDALVARGRISPALRAAIAADTAADVAAFAAACQALEPRRAEAVAEEGREQAFAAIAADCGPEELPELVGWLRSSGHLNIGLLLRALAGRDAAFLRQTLVELTGFSVRRVEGLARHPENWGFAVLCHKAGFAHHLLPALQVAVALAQSQVHCNTGVDGELAQRIARAIESLRDPALASIEAKVWRLASEGARDKARSLASTAPDFAPLRPLRSAPPVLLLEAGAGEHAPPVILDREASLRVAA